METPAGWDLYRSFLAVLRHGSLSAAARALAVTQPTVGRHVDALEQALDASLFTRSRHGLAPTEAALALRPYAEAMAASADALVRAASWRGAGTPASVRVTASEIVGTEVLPAILADLRERHPAIAVELVVSNQLDDLLQRAADIAVRMVRPTQDALLARRLGTVALGLYAHERYLDRHGTPQVPADLAHHAVIGFDQDTPLTRRLVPPDLPFGRQQFSLRTDSDVAQLAAIRAGCGIGACQVGLAGRSATLVRVLPRAFAAELEMWVVMHEDLARSRPCRILFDALCAGLAAYIAEAAA